MVEQCALKIKSVLAEVEIVDLDFKSSSDYTALIRCKFDDNLADGVSSFIEKFSNETNTNWIVRRTFPTLLKLAFHKVFVCQHNDFNKGSRKKSDSNSNMRNRNKKCNAKIDVKIKKITDATIDRDPYLKNGLNGQVKICFNHTHRIEVAECLSYLRMNTSTRETFLKYFDDGLSPVAAMNFHESILIANASDENELISTLANTGFNPTDRQIYYLYNTWRCKKWKNALGFVGNHKYANLSPEQCSSRIKVCKLHFTEDSFRRHASKHRLSKNATPLMNLYPKELAAASNWSQDDKRLLLVALRNYGDSDLTLIQTTMPHKSIGQIRAMMDHYKKLAQMKWLTHEDRKSDEIRSWIDIMEKICSSQKGCIQDVIPRVLKYIALFEKRNVQSDIDLRAAYTALSEISYGRSTKELPERTCFFLYQCLVRLAENLQRQDIQDSQYYLKQLESFEELLKLSVEDDINPLSLPENLLNVSTADFCDDLMQ